MSRDRQSCGGSGSLAPSPVASYMREESKNYFPRDAGILQDQIGTVLMCSLQTTFLKF